MTIKVEMYPLVYVLLLTLGSYISFRDTLLLEDRATGNRSCCAFLIMDIHVVNLVNKNNLDSIHIFLFDIRFTYYYLITWSSCTRHVLHIDIGLSSSNSDISVGNTMKDLQPFYQPTSQPTLYYPFFICRCCKIYLCQVYCNFSMLKSSNICATH